MFAVVALVAAGCGDDDDDVTTDTAADDETGAEFDMAAFCDAAIEAEAIFIAGPGIDEATGEPTPEGLEAFTAELEPHLDTIRANIPPEIESEVDTVLAGVDEALATGDPSLTETPEFFEAESVWDAWVFDNCEFSERAELVAVEYEFQDVPESLSTGRVGLRLDNQGDEVHEAVVFRIADEEERPVEELLELPEEEVENVVEFVGFTFAGPGDSGAAVVDIEDAGRYALVCFVPVGTTDVEVFLGSEEEQEEDDAPPHFTEGMFAEFTVS